MIPMLGHERVPTTRPYIREKLLYKKIEVEERKDISEIRTVVVSMTKSLQPRENGEIFGKEKEKKL